MTFSPLSRASSASAAISRPEAPVPRSAGGAKIHVCQDFVVDHIQADTVMVRVGLKLDADVTDLEVRVRIEAGADLWLGQIEIHPLAAPATIADESLPDSSVIA